MRFALILAGLMVLTGCGNGSPIPAGAAVVLRVLPESAVDGGAVGSVTTRQRSTAGGLVVDIVTTGATNLKALYFELDYDATALSPAGATASGVLAGAAAEAQAASLLELPVLDQPGTVTHGQVLAGWDRRDGFTGSGVLASVRFVTVALGAAGQRVADESRSAASATAQNYLERFELDFDADAQEVSWYYDFPGDFDQNGTVAITDLSRFAQHYGLRGNVPVSAAERNTANGVADADANGQITIGDLAKLGQNFNLTYGGCLLAHAVDVSAGYPIKPEQIAAQNLDGPLNIPFSSATGNPQIERLKFSASTAGHKGRFYWVVAPGDRRLPVVSKVAVALPRPWAPNLYDPNWNLSYDPETGDVTCLHTLRGDGSQDGLVNVTDITPIGALFGATGPFATDSAEWAIDYNRDQVIDTWDFYLTDVFFGEGFDEVALFATTQVSQVPQDPYAAEQLDPLAIAFRQGNAYERRFYAMTLPAEYRMPGTWLWVRPVLRTGGYGTRSELIQIP
jgi:hypothetical protein